MSNQGAPILCGGFSGSKEATEEEQVFNNY